MERQKGPEPSLIISIFAVIVSFSSLGVSIWGEQSTQAYNRLSVRPILAFDANYSPSAAPQAGIGLYLSNYGTGVALLQTLTVYVDSKVVTPSNPITHTLTEAYRKLGLLDKADFPLQFSEILRRPMRPGDSVNLLAIARDQVTTERLDTLAAAISRLKIHIQYESVYEEPFQVDFDGSCCQ